MPKYKLKFGTTDVCAVCHRPIEYMMPPVNEDLPFWRRRPSWVDIEPVGDDLCNPWCKPDEQSVEHKPLNYCGVMTSSGQPCYTKVKEPVDGVYACGRHIKNELRMAERRAEYMENQSQRDWEDESIEGVTLELQRKGLTTYQKGVDYLPYSVQRNGRIIDVVKLLQFVEDLETKYTVLRLVADEEGWKHDGD